MATIIPGLDSRATSGGRRFAQRIESLLEDDYLCWFNVPIGRQYQHPDFVLLHRRHGLLVIEVNEWQIDQIKALNNAGATLLTDQGLKEVPNPLEQVRSYAFALAKMLERDPALRVAAGQLYEGRLVCPFGYGLVLSQITRAQFDTAELGEVLPAHLVICKDEIAQSTTATAFEQRLWDMFLVRFERELSNAQIDRIRWHLFPEVRIAEADESSASMRVMDLEQELLARSAEALFGGEVRKWRVSLELLRGTSLRHEGEQIAARLNASHRSGTAWKEMAVLFPAYFMAEEITASLQNASIPFESVQDGASADVDRVQVMTMHASQGREFPIVCIAGLGFMPYRPGQEAQDARLLYLAMTSATEHLFVTASKDSEFVHRLTRALHGPPAPMTVETASASR